MFIGACASTKQSENQKTGISGTENDEQFASVQESLGLGHALKEMKVQLKLPSGIEMLPVVGNNDVEYQVRFHFPNKGYEVRISLFPESYLIRESHNGDIDFYVPRFTMGLLAYIADQTLPYSTAVDIPSKICKDEFGADRELSVLVKGNQSDFGKGYDQITLVMLYKIGKGVVIVYFLFNDPHDLDGLDFRQAYYCFAFR